MSTFVVNGRYEPWRVIHHETSPGNMLWRFECVAGFWDQESAK